MVQNKHAGDMPVPSFWSSKRKLTISNGVCYVCFKIDVAERQKRWVEKICIHSNLFTILRNYNDALVNIDEDEACAPLTLAYYNLFVLPVHPRRCIAALHVCWHLQDCVQGSEKDLRNSLVSLKKFNFVMVKGKANLSFGFWIKMVPIQIGWMRPSNDLAPLQELSLSAICGGLLLWPMAASVWETRWLQVNH